MIRLAKQRGEVCLHTVSASPLLVQVLILTCPLKVKTGTFSLPLTLISHSQKFRARCL